jgi:hypothetical protein
MRWRQQRHERRRPYTDERLRKSDPGRARCSHAAVVAQWPEGGVVTLALAMPVVPPRPTLRRRLSDLLYTRRGLLLLALLAPPLLWFGVVYVGALLALLANAFFGLDDFTGQVVREFTLKNFAALTEGANVDVALRTVLMATAVTVASIVLAFPLAYHMARHARGAAKAALYIAVMLPLWSSYLVRLYAWKLLLAKEGAVSWLAAQLHLTWALEALLSIPGLGGSRSASRRSAPSSSSSTCGCPSWCCRSRRRSSAFPAP